MKKGRKGPNLIEIADMLLWGCLSEMFIVWVIIVVCVILAACIVILA